MDASKPTSNANCALKSSVNDASVLSELFETTTQTLNILEKATVGENERLKKYIEELFEFENELSSAEKKLRDVSFAKELAELERKRVIVNERESSEVSKKQELDKVLLEVIDKKKQLHEQGNGLESLVNVDSKGVRMKLELFRTLTSLSWNQTSEPHLCEGYVALMNDTRPFSLDKNKNSPVYIANYLWDLIDDST